MLVLSRKRNEGIQIGDQVRIVVVEIRGDKVRLGIDADRDIAVHRDEVLRRTAQRVDQAARDGTLSQLEAALDQEENR